jgi:hypothetical protein
MQTFKMLRKHGTGYPFCFNEHLAQLENMVVVEMTAAEIHNAVFGDTVVPKRPEQVDAPEKGLKTKPSDRPGPGWVKSNGKWVRKQPKKVAEQSKPTQEVATAPEV